MTSLTFAQCITSQNFLYKCGNPCTYTKKFSERKQVHVGMEPSKTILVHILCEYCKNA